MTSRRIAVRLADLMNDVLSSAIAESNSDFSTSIPSFFNIDFEDDEGFIKCLADGEYHGRHVRDVPYYKNEIEFTARVTMQKVMANIGYKDLDVEFSTNMYKWREPSSKEEDFEDPARGNRRPSEAFIEQYGGFRFGEDRTQLLRRMAEIDRLRKRIEQGKANVGDIDALSALLGTDDEYEDEDPFGLLKDD